MSVLFHEFVARAADSRPESLALKHREITCDYASLQLQCERFANALIALGVKRHDRIAVYLPKQIETVVAIFGTARAGAVFVPINPGLKPKQVQHIVRDCGARVLVTSTQRLSALTDVLRECTELTHVITVSGTTDSDSEPPSLDNIRICRWADVALADISSLNSAAKTHRVIDTDIAAILYTSGSTGSPKGVVLSHRNLVMGAVSVAEYLENSTSDRLLAVLPLSFDYGLSQLSTAFYVGASVVLIEHLFARDVIAALAAEQVTGLAAVPPLWNQLADLTWPKEINATLRYITNSGGAMPAATLRKLRAQLHNTKIFLMYGLTEAFRSTYLPPQDIDRKPGSIGKAIPNAEVLVIRANGSECAAHEPGELVHSGALVAMGYWNAPELTALRFRAAPTKSSELSLPNIAVWSGDTVKRDEEGYLYFLSRQDDMIKTSGYRVSPTEIEDVILQTDLAAEAVAFGVPHPSLGQAIAVIAVMHEHRNQNADADQALLTACRQLLPAFMIPLHIEWRDSLPRNPNGKYDRKALATELRDLFSDAS